MQVTFTKKRIKQIAAAAGLAAATAAVGITAIVTSVGSSAAQRLLPIYRVDRGDNKVSLTFDVAWENSNTNELIEILDEYGARATFFVTGDWCDRYPEDVKKFYDAGHEIQNHSDVHPHVEGMNVNELISDTREASRKIKMITGEEPTLYRAPYGEYDDSLIITLDGMGMKVIQWDVDSIDWKNPSAEDIKKRVCSKAESGSILLFHNDLENTTEALPQILSELKGKGFEFVSVSELIYADNYTIDASGEQQPVVQSAAHPSEKEVAAIAKRYSRELEAVGITAEQLTQMINAARSGTIPELTELPEEAREVIARIVDEAAPAETSPETAPEILAEPK